MKKFYITNAIPYVNAKPHIGHALEFVQSDAIARYHKLLGEDVLFLCGSDDNALKNVRAAEQAGAPVAKFVDENAKSFQDLSQKLNVQFDIFQKGNDRTHHYPSSQLLWQLCAKSGDIYKKNYTGLYCVGCEQFYTKAELDEKDECLEHPGKKLEKVSEENYFFRLSKYQDQLTKLIESEKLTIYPKSRKNEVLSFLKNPLHDISISRSNERAKNWGVPVPGDLSQRIYVWFDALNIYQSGIGFGWDEKKYKTWWPADIHVIGKGIIRFHAVYWPALLLSAGLNLPRSLVVHGYITVEGKKMSKSVGNIVDPFEFIKKYSKDAVRYYLLREIPTLGDGDFSESRFKELYNADLAHGLGNLVARLTTLAQGYEYKGKNELSDSYHKRFEKFILNEVLKHIWSRIQTVDKYLNEKKPWDIKDKEKLKTVLEYPVQELRSIATELSPFLPETAKKIHNATSGPVQKLTGLFPRL